ncbi:hypothetical protein BH11MYX3_BH11MYX3_47170 [soil metagenome]
MRLLALLLGMTACTSGDLDPGRAVACRECGPGAVTAGRFVHDEYRSDVIAANHLGQMVRAAKGGLAWLDGSLRPALSVPLDGAYSELEPARIAIADDGEVVLIGHEWDDFNPNPELREIAADGHQRWRIPTGVSSEPDQIAIGPSLVFLGPGRSPAPYKLPGHVLTGNFIVALDRATGALVWEVPLPLTTSVYGTPIHLAAMPDGGVAVSGEFTGELALGGTAATLTAPPAARAAGYVAALDAAGRGRWVIELDPGDAESHVADSNLGALASAPGGEVAVIGTWDGAAAMFGGVPLAHVYEGSNPVGQMIALIAPGGGVTWAHPFGRRSDSITSLVTDGVEVIAAGSRDTAVSFDVDRTEPVGSDGYFVSTDTAQRWFRAARGNGYQDVTVHALTADGVLASVHSWTTEDDTLDPTLTIGDVHADGPGFLIAKLAR